MNKTRVVIALLLSTLVIMFATAAPSLANTGRWTFNEWQNLRFAGMSNPDNIKDANDKCNCTGSLIKSWTDSSDQKHRRYAYDNVYETNGVTINFRLRSDGSEWIATDSKYCDANGCLYAFGV